MDVHQCWRTTPPPPLHPATRPIWSQNFNCIFPCRRIPRTSTKEMASNDAMKIPGPPIQVQYLNYRGIYQLNTNIIISNLRKFRSMFIISGLKINFDLQQTQWVLCNWDVAFTWMEMSLLLSYLAILLGYTQCSIYCTVLYTHTLPKSNAGTYICIQHHDRYGFTELKKRTMLLEMLKPWNCSEFWE